MTPEFWAIIGVGVALGTLILSGQHRLRGEMAAMEERLRGEMAAQGKRLDRVEAGLAELRERVAHVEGVLEGLRDALVARGLPEPPKKTRRATG